LEHNTSIETGPENLGRKIRFVPVLKDDRNDGVLQERDNLNKEIKFSEINAQSDK
jgi:hypothetical protein